MNSRAPCAGDPRRVQLRAVAALAAVRVPDPRRKCRRECLCGFHGCPLRPVWLCAGKMWPGIVRGLCVALCASCELLLRCSRILMRSAARVLFRICVRWISSSSCRRCRCSTAAVRIRAGHRSRAAPGAICTAGTAARILGRCIAAPDPLRRSSAEVPARPLPFTVRRIRCGAAHRVRDQSAELSGIVSAWPSGSAAELLRSSALYL